MSEANADGYGPFAQPMFLGGTEYGGDAGVVQGVGGKPGVGRDELKTWERLGMANRTDPSDPSGVDPVTGLVVGDE